MQHSLTQGPITKNILLFALPLGVTGIWLSVPIGRALEEEKIKYPPPQNVFWHVCSGGSCFFWGSK